MNNVASQELYQMPPKEEMSGRYQKGNWWRCRASTKVFGKDCLVSCMLVGSRDINKGLSTPESLKSVNYAIENLDSLISHTLKDEMFQGQLEIMGVKSAPQIDVVGIYGYANGTYVLDIDVSAPELGKRACPLQLQFKGSTLEEIYGDD